MPIPPARAGAALQSRAAAASDARASLRTRASMRRDGRRGSRQCEDMEHASLGGVLWQVAHGGMTAVASLARHGASPVSRHGASFAGLTRGAMLLRHRPEWP